jgi:hypothetical protein
MTLTAVALSDICAPGFTTTHFCATYDYHLQQAKVVNVLCLMAGIVIICNSDSKTTSSADSHIAAKAKLLFDVFDFNQKGYINRDETSILLLSVSQIMRIITVRTSTAAAAVDAAGMDAMANELFTQGALDNDEMTGEQFVSIAVQYLTSTHADDEVYSIMLDKLGLISNKTAAASDTFEYATAHSEPQVSAESVVGTHADMNSVTVSTADVVNPTANDSSINTAECGSIAMITDIGVQAQSIIADTSSENNSINTMDKDVAAAEIANKNDTGTVLSTPVDAAATVDAVSDVVASLQEVTSVSAHANDTIQLASTATEIAPVPWWQTVASQTVTSSTVATDDTRNSGAAADTNVMKQQHGVTQPLATTIITTSADKVATLIAAAAVEPVTDEKHSDVAKTSIAYDDLHVSKSAKDKPVLQRADSELQQEAAGVILLADKSAYSVQHQPQLLLLTAAADTVIEHTATATATVTTVSSEHVLQTAIDDMPPVATVNDDTQAITLNTSDVKQAVEENTHDDDTSKPVVPVDAVEATVADLSNIATFTGNVLATSSGDNTSTSHDDDDNNIAIKQQPSAVQQDETVCNGQTDVTPVLTTAASSTATVGTSAAQTRLLQRADSELQQEATGIILLSDKAAYNEEQKPQFLLLTA